ncbi:MAG: hypothetical protein R3324_11995 [Halobacteriales archaeon]|nr:hypothetical protein [Halobacteriales archaeon]
MVEIEPIWTDWPYARIRRIVEKERGRVSRFVIQLEYDVGRVDSEKSTPSWRVVARFDHDSAGAGGHDVTEEGLHMDVYRGGLRYRRARGYPTLPPGEAMRFAERHLVENSRRLIARFERWHELHRPGERR